MFYRFIISLVLLFNYSILFAQQCGWENKNVFVIHPKKYGSVQIINGLRIYLLNEKNEPYTYSAYHVISDEPYRTVNYLDTLHFIQNNSISKNNYKFPSIVFESALENYFVVIPEFKDFKAHPEHAPIYKAMIVDADGELNGGYFPTEYIYLPYTQSVSICENSFHHKHSSDNLSEIKMVDGQSYHPIYLSLKKPIKEVAAEVEANTLGREGFSYRLNFDTIKVGNKIINQYKIKSIEIYDLAKLTKVQTIYRKDSLLVTPSQVNNAIQLIDFKNNGKKGLIIQSSSTANKNLNAYNLKFDFYNFNSLSQKFELDTFLSRLPNTFYIPQLKKFKRVEYSVTPESYVQKIYFLMDGKWEFFESKESKRYVQPSAGNETTKRTMTDAQCIWFKDDYHILPLQVPSYSSPSSVIVRDTFIIYNQCNESIKIKNVRSENREAFKLEQTLAPQSKNYIYYEETLYPNSNYEMLTKTLNLELNNGIYKSVSIKIPLVSSTGYTTTLNRNRDNSIEQIVLQNNGLPYETEINTYASGKLRDMGKRMKNNPDQRVGKWQRFNDRGISISDTIYSKLIAFKPMNFNNYKPINFKIKIRENGIWKEPFSWTENTEKFFYVFNGTDSVVAFTDSSSHSYSIPYSTMPEYAIFQFYFLKQNQPYLLISGTKYPFYLTKDVYVLRWDYSNVKFNRNNRVDDFEDSLLLRLKNRFPKMQIVTIWSKLNGIDVSQMSNIEKENLLRVLKTDSAIRIICQVFNLAEYSKSTFCDNSIFMQFKNATSFEEAKKIGKEFGFTCERIGMQSNNFEFRYQSNMVNEKFFTSYNSFCEHEKVMYGSLNSYMQVELDGFGK